MHELTAQALSAAYAAGDLSPVAALAAVLDRIGAINGKLNAIVTLDVPGAAGAAQASESRWRTGAALSPLDGVPITIKDNIPVAGLRTTWGSRLYADFVPALDELPVARLRAAGLVILGKTNVPEFTLSGYTSNALFGPTRNPYDPRLTPGGSSGGAVTAVAAGMGPVALGTDGGGSIRRPASHTGLVGLKPSRGRVARCDGLPAILLDFESIGPIARTTADVVMLMRVIAAPHARDPASAAFFDRPFALPAAAPGRILYIPRFGDAPVDAEIAASVTGAARRLAALGHAVDEGPVPFDVDRLNAAWSVIGPAGLAWLLKSMPDWRGKVGPEMASMADAGAALAALDYVAALDAIAELREQLGETFTRYDAIMTPTAAALPWPATESHPPLIGGVPVGPRGHAVFTAFANVAGCPGINIPCEPSAGGLPIGFQLVARPGGDGLLCTLAGQYEIAHPWAARRPSL